MHCCTDQVCVNDNFHYLKDQRSEEQFGFFFLTDAKDLFKSVEYNKNGKRITPQWIKLMNKYLATKQDGSAG